MWNVNPMVERLIKLIIVLALSWVIYQQVLARENAAELWSAFKESLTWDRAGWFVAALLLIPVNWAFETLKWKVLIRDIERLSFWKMYSAILAGVTFSVFTPNRIGEYAGRILFVKAENNWKTVVATLVGSFSQLLILLSVGLLGLSFFVAKYLELEVYVLLGILCLGLVGVVAMVVFFYNVDLIVPVVKRLPFSKYLKPYVRHLSVLRNYRADQLSRVLFFAFLRYTTYSLQYYLMLMYFGVEVPLITGLACIATIFLLQTSIPLPPIMGLLMRGEVALFVWGNFSDQELNILAATFTLWVINMILPALIGIVFIVNINVLKSLGYASKGD
ncbi:MAG: lysylphosphatidylglycerol synthase transmembrane domain-containing protein [Saprospiraceae bacterium]